MKKLVPLALIGAAVGAAAFILNKNNKQHIQNTIDTLDEISKKATETVSNFANEVIDSIEKKD